MKTKRTYGILFSILAALLVITGCNADASAGLFRQLANSREIVDVRYNQLLGQDPASKNLYFLTDKGIYATAGETTSTGNIIANSKDKLIQSAYFDKTDTLLYTINSKPAKVQKYVVGTGPSPELSPSPALMTTLLSVRVLPNGLFMLTGKNASDTIIYALVDSGDINTDISGFSSDVGLIGYSPVSILQKSGFGTNSITSEPSEPVVVSFVSGSTYKNFYIPKTAPHSATEINIDNKKRIVNFFESGTELYLLTTDGIIFKGDSTSLGTAFTKIHDASETYPDHAFGYLVGTSPTLHYITKPNNKDQLTVFTINADTNAVTTTTVTKGYAKLIYNTEIVDALQLSSGDLLVATARNGMYKINITTPNSNDDTNGSSSEAEKYFP
jgi:hypothetical protein